MANSVTVECSVLIRCNAGHACGYGHVSRCLTLARAFVERRGKITFALTTPDAAPLIREKEHDAFILNAEGVDENFFQLVTELKPDIVILDVRPPHSLSILKEIRKNIKLLVVLDDLSEQLFAADVAYLPPVPAVAQADWSGFSGQKRIGLQWMLTGVNFVPPPYRMPQPPYRVLMSMGGSDPWGYTDRLAPIFAKICHEKGLIFGVLLGPGFKHRNLLRDYITQLPGSPAVFEDTPDMGEVYGWCDAAVTAMGVSAYELAHSAKPALYVCADEEHRCHAEIFENYGFGKIFPLHDSDDQALYASELVKFLQEALSAPFAHDFYAGRISSDPANDMVEDIMNMAWKSHE